MVGLALAAPAEEAQVAGQKIGGLTENDLQKIIGFGKLKLLFLLG